MGWVDLISNSTADYFVAKGVSKKYTNELIEAGTRVNYGQVSFAPFLIAQPPHRLKQNVLDIHALEGAASLAASYASGVRGGNFQIFENFLNRSGAKVHLNTRVSSSNTGLFHIELT
jgi:prenylcysteine oxidase / farnesylcysteine lyase